MSALAAAANIDGAYRRGVLLVILAGTCWSIMGIVVRLTESASAWQILFYRSLTLSAFVLIVMGVRAGSIVGLRHVFRKMGVSAVAGGLALVFAFCGSIVAIKETTVANAMFLFATAPFFAALLARVLLGEAVRTATWIAMAVAAVGIAIMVAEGITLGHLLGNLWATISAVGFAFFTLALRWKRSDDMFPAVFLGGVFTTIVMGLLCVSSGEGLAIPLRDVGLSVCLGVVQLGLGLSLYTIGSRHVPAAELALLAMTEVVLGPFWVWLFLGETAGTGTLIGGVVLLSALAYNAVSGLRHKPVPIA